MKRIACILLCLILALSTAACSPSENAGNTREEAGGEDLSLLSPGELYARAVEKTEALSSSYYETQVKKEDGTLLYTLKTSRVRQGYDSFSYSRRGLDSVTVADGFIYTENGIGKFFAPCTARTAKEYLSDFVFPVVCLEKESLSGMEKEELCVSYTLSDGATVSLFAAALPEEEGTLVPEKVTGTAYITSAGLIEKEILSVTGTRKDGGEAVALVLESDLVSYRSEDVQVTSPEDKESYGSVGDVRIPALLDGAVTLLENKETLQATILSAQSLTAGDKTSALHTEITFYQKDPSSVYYSRQSLKTSAEAEESRFYQMLMEGGTKTENEYDVILGEKLSETVSAGDASPWKEVLSQSLLSLSAMNEVTLSEERGQNTVSFSLGQEGISALSGAIASLFPEAAVAGDFTGEGSGLFTVDAESGELVSFSFSFRSSSAGGTVSGQYSVTVDESEDVTLPSLQIPTPTTPGMEGDHGDHSH